MARPKQIRPASATPGAEVTDWLALVEHDGAFLTPGVLRGVFKDGFDRLPKDLRPELRARVAELTDDPPQRRELRDWLLREVLGWGTEFVEGQQVPQAATATVAEHGVTIRPDQALVDVDDANRVRVGVFAWPMGTDLDARLPQGVSRDGWRASPRERAERWAREAGIPLGLVTNDDHWILVWSPRGAAAASGAIRLVDLADERVLQDGFVSLLGAKRFFSVSDDPKQGETLERLFEFSADTEVEVTKGLGRQVRRSVELLVSAVSREHVASHGRLLASVADTEVYEAAVTVLMRLVFLLFAEERRLLPAEDALWAESYSVLDLRDELRAAALRDGDDALEKRATAWARLLATFRAVHGGVNHDRLSLPAYGGALFDPERFPFLEGRHESGSGIPPTVDDRTVLAILDALLTVEVKQGRGRVRQQVSYKALDVEQIGHCYEGLLDHGCAPVDVLSVGLRGPEADEPEFTVDDLDRHRANGDDALLEWLSDKTRCDKTPAALAKLLDANPTGLDLARLRASCDNDGEAVNRVLPYWGLLRSDLRELPVVFPPGGKYVTQTSTRRNMGAQYTTKALAEEVVQYALEPLTYDPGPQNEETPENWKIRTPAQILDLKVCDPAVGSGAILTAAGRYLADRLLDAVDEHGPGAGPMSERLADLMSASPEDRVTLARREVVDHCLYGVDKNPVAAEMAKLSLWLTTMARDRPFTFLDHAIQSGDSLLGITSIDQLRWLHLDPASRRGAGGFATLAIDSRIAEATELAEELQAISVVTGRDAVHKRLLHERLTTMLDDLSVVADIVVGASLRAHAVGPGAPYEDLIAEVADRIRVALNHEYTVDERDAAMSALRGTAELLLRTGLPDQASPNWERRCLHWPIAYPEVFMTPDGGGFDLILGNPPYAGATQTSAANGVTYRHHLMQTLGRGETGKIDLVVFFLLLAASVGRSASFLTTNSISQTSSREVGLDYLLEAGWLVHRADTGREWPGDAAVSFLALWITSLSWTSSVTLNGLQIRQISPGLTAAGRTSGPARRLAMNAGKAFVGSKTRGQGFVLSPGEAAELLKYDAASKEVVRPFLSGSDLNSSPVQQASRWVINFGKMGSDAASLYPSAWQIVSERVRPDRQASKVKGLRERWWQFEHHASGLYEAIAERSRTLAIAEVSYTVQPAFVSTDQVFMHKVIVIAEDSDECFGLMSSAFHYWWTVSEAASFRTAPSYSPSDVYETFAQPGGSARRDLEEVAQIAKDLDRFRSDLMTHTNVGLTKTYNRVHDQGELDPDVVRLRELHVQLDHAVRDAYGWSELVLGHHHWETPQGMRFTVSPEAKDELLDRLLELNHQRYAEEVAAGLHDTKKAKGSKKTASNQGSLDIG